MHRPAFDGAWFSLSLDVRIWVTAVWLVGLWCMDHEDAPFAQEAWAIQREHWSEETDFHVVTAPMRFEWPNVARDLPQEAPPTPPPFEVVDVPEETQAEMIVSGYPGVKPYRGHPPRVALYRVGPARHDVFLLFGDHPAWMWI